MRSSPCAVRKCPKVSILGIFRAGILTIMRPPNSDSLVIYSSS
jgi:hypothetical protein